MAYWIEDLEDLCEKVTEEISDINEKIDQNGGKMSSGDLEVIDKLTHALKSIKTTIAMAEYDDDYSRAEGGNAGGGNMGGSSNRDGRSGARGRGRNARRDSMGRYSSRGYSREEAMEGIADEIRDAMQSMPEHLKKEAQKFLSKIEQEM